MGLVIADCGYLFCKSAILISSEPIRIMSSTYAYRVNAISFFFSSEETASDPVRLNNGGRIETAEKCVGSLSQRINFRGEVTL